MKRDATESLVALGRAFLQVIDALPDDPMDAKPVEPVAGDLRSPPG